MLPAMACWCSMNTPFIELQALRNQPLSCSVTSLPDPHHPELRKGEILNSTCSRKMQA